MFGRMRRCPQDGNYTLSFRCKVCQSPTVPVHPPRFSPQDRYGRYRRQMRLWTR
ncbi:MAG: RNA-protein complex protein Nop10 [Methanocalculus sp.]|uniref:RNA-protein complex protein Nop10 n=1 Tax=Methanocalculus sp. TaxID=2004547 RepID=UPI0027158DC0|nr:RNA-protein complex protein Nop10 [Methanocalculus sp.]MDO8842022.1 RNA-protein complex protein Nop10 [Methanocalculus sp.]MDO9539129.1 RNA-protein complex protein Nop10 [Methanocalculus sp.]